MAAFKYLRVDESLVSNHESKAKLTEDAANNLDKALADKQRSYSINLLEMPPYPEKSKITVPWFIGEGTVKDCEKSDYCDRVLLYNWSANSKVMRHYHDNEVEKIEVVRGDMLVIVDGVNYELQEHNYIWIKPGSLHALKALTDVEFYAYVSKQ